LFFAKKESVGCMIGGVSQTMDASHGSIFGVTFRGDEENIHDEREVQQGRGND
jgi:hypothetical protein